MAGLCDKYLPDYRFCESHSVEIRAAPEAVFSAIRDYDMRSDALIRAAVTLREFPLSVFRRLGISKTPASELFDLNRFSLLEETDEEIAFGLIGKFWQVGYGLERCGGGKEFLQFDKPRTAKLVLSFKVEPVRTKNLPKTVLLHTETRVFCPDAYSFRCFAPYWYLIRPVSGLIRKRMLAAVKKKGEVV